MAVLSACVMSYLMHNINIRIIICVCMAVLSACVMSYIMHNINIRIIICVCMAVLSASYLYVLHTAQYQYTYNYMCMYGCFKCIISVRLTYCTISIYV